MPNYLTLKAAGWCGLGLHVKERERAGGLKEGNGKGAKQQLREVTDLFHFTKQGWDHLLI